MSEQPWSSRAHPGIALVVATFSLVGSLPVDAFCEKYELCTPLDDVLSDFAENNLDPFGQPPIGGGTATGGGDGIVTAEGHAVFKIEMSGEAIVT